MNTDQQMHMFDGGAAMGATMVPDHHSPDDLVDQIKRRLRAVNIVSFSGGKDSTVVLQLVLEAMAGTGKKLYIVTADTLMEIPYFKGYVDRVTNQLREYLDTTDIDASVVEVAPQYKDSFWVSVLGKGYPAAHMGFRWCTGKLKIEPITKYIKTVTTGKNYTVFVGVRKAESALRDKIYQAKDYKQNHFAPILYWTANDVWEFLMSAPCLFSDHSDLIKVYRYSSDECVYGEKQGVCVGNARYGCWACPLQKTTQLNLIGMNTKDGRYQLLKTYKQNLAGMANKRAFRSRIRRNGQVGAGPFLVKVRRRLFGDLKVLEQKTGWRLITPVEEELIKAHWVVDESIHNVPDDTQPMLWGV